MKKALKRIEYKIWHYQDGKTVGGAPSGVRGDLSGVRGEIDDCEITDEERKRGISIKELIKN